MSGFFVVHETEYAGEFIEAEVAGFSFPLAVFVFGVPVSREDIPVYGGEVGLTKRASQTASPAASAHVSDAGSDPGRSSEASLRYEEAKLHSRVFVHEQHGGLISGVTFFYDVGGMIFHSPSFRYCPWSERSSPTLKRS